MTVAAPTPQKSRSRSNCRCGGPCFYCRRELPGSHEHDHMPIPARHGGQLTVPACKFCHSLKDRYDFSSWTPEQLDGACAAIDAHEDCGFGAWMLMGVLLGKGGYTDDEPLIFRAEQVLEYIGKIEVTEGRILFAAIYARALDTGEVSPYPDVPRADCVRWQEWLAAYFPSDPDEQGNACGGAA